MFLGHIVLPLEESVWKLRFLKLIGHTGKRRIVKIKVKRMIDFE